MTLLGQATDWQSILTPLESIDQLGEQPRQFARMLRPILERMILTFEDPSNVEVTSFWNRIVQHNHVGSGTDYLSGWLTALCCWDDKGQPKHCGPSWSGDESHELFDGLQYPGVDIDSAPLGYATVPVKVKDNGVEFDAAMVAGSVGIVASSSSSTNHSTAFSEIQEAQLIQTATAPSIRDTIQPVSGWWIYTNEAAAQGEAREAEKKQLEEAVHQYLQGWDVKAKRTTPFYETAEWKDYVAKSNRLRELKAF